MRRPTSDPGADHAPQTRLVEGPLRSLLGYQLAQARLVTDQVFDSQVGRTLGLRPVEFTLLALVQANPGATARQLARALAVTPPHVAVWVERLEGRGLIARVRSERDARVQHITATTEGLALARRATRRLIEGEQTILASLTAAEQAMLLELVHKAAMGRGRGAAR